MRKNIGCSKTGHHRIRLAVRNQAHNLCKRGTTFCANANPASMKSTTYTDKARFAVQVGDERPGLEAVMKAVARREIDMVAAWSGDRLGRSLIDLLDFLRELPAKGVDLFLHQQGIDTSTPAGKAMFQMMGVFAEFERAMIRERVLAGLARARDTPSPGRENVNRGNLP